MVMVCPGIVRSLFVSPTMMMSSVVVKSPVGFGVGSDGDVVVCRASRFGVGVGVWTTTADAEAARDRKKRCSISSTTEVPEKRRKSKTFWVYKPVYDDNGQTISEKGCVSQSTFMLFKLPNLATSHLPQTSDA